MFSSKNQFLTGAGGYQIQRSVRTRASASGYFSRTPASATNRRTFTWSGWVKRGASGDGTLSNHFFLFTAGTTTAFCAVDFYQNNIRLNFGNGTYLLVTSAFYRDYSSWYHIVVSVDTTQATSANRVKLYVNGLEVTAFSTSLYPIQNYDTAYNNTVAQRIGFDGSANYFDGYITEINFIDGQALTPSSFGQTNPVTGVWQPIKYTGTYGTNGFYLNFVDNSASTAATIGKDNSGNGNNWTPNNISVTAGITYDSMLDTPTLFADGGNGRGNYAVFNSAFRGQATYSNANQTVTTVGGAASNQWSYSPVTIGASSSKYYCEFYVNTKDAGAGGAAVGIGVVNATSISTYTFGNYIGLQSNGEYSYQAHGYTFFNNVQSGTAVWASYTTGDTIGLAVDLDSSICYWYKNNALQGSTSILSGTVFLPTVSCYQTSQVTSNFGQRPFTYTPPTGFVALNTQNLPTPAISNGATVMAATTWSGDATTPRSISNAVNGISFQPDFVWAKARSSASYAHNLFDSIRGVGKVLQSNATAAEITNDGNGYLSAFNSNGFAVTTGTTSAGNINASGITYVAWQWKAGTTSASNTNGSITSTVSAGATQGFSVVTYTGTGANATVGHGLGVAPKMILAKARSLVQDWAVYHASIGAGNWLQLDTTSASLANATVWQGVTPTSTVFSLGTAGVANPSASGMIAYCFSEVAGFSKIGSYTGNGSTDGPFVYCGFRPRFILIKNSAAATDWVVRDTTRDTYNVTSNTLYANIVNADSSTADTIDILSNGFKLRNSGAYINSAATFIFMAFAENPFKYSLAR